MQETIKYVDKRTKTELIHFEQNPQEAKTKIIEGKKYIQQINKEKLYQLSNEEDKIEKYNKENWQNGICIQIPENKKAKINIETTTNKFTAHRKQIILQKNSQATIIDRTQGEATTNSETTEIFLEENTKLNYIKIQTLGKNTTNFSIKKTKLSKNSKLNQTNILLGAKTNIERTEIDLNQEKSQATVTDIIFQEENQHYDISTTTQHTQKNTTSEINAKIALQTQSRCIYRPLIKIKPNATNSKGNQKGKILMLSQEAKADPIPSLDIENNEVQCSHGIGITQIDDEKLFYLETRGINPETAKKEIIKGFFKTTLKDQKTEQELKKEVEKRIQKNTQKWTPPT